MPENHLSAPEAGDGSSSRFGRFTSGTHRTGGPQSRLKTIPASAGRRMPVIQPITLTGDTKNALPTNYYL
jgi:hypothetical protein